MTDTLDVQGDEDLEFDVMMFLESLEPDIWIDVTEDIKSEG